MKLPGKRLSWKNDGDYMVFERATGYLVNVLCTNTIRFSELRINSQLALTKSLPLENQREARIE